MCAAKNGNTPLIDSKKCASRAPGACFIPPERFDAMALCASKVQRQSSIKKDIFREPAIAP